ncbi:MAG: hypothetical protein NUV81_00825 [bacterium]|nr:hypothetical protein [bacterium]
MERLRSRNGLEMIMFSETGLGSFLRGVYSGTYPELMRKKSALTLTALLLADQSILQHGAILQELHQVLVAIYGDDATWRCHEAPVHEVVSAELAQILEEFDSEHLKAGAYIAGLIGASMPTVSCSDTRCQRIHAKMLRIFRGQVSSPLSQGANTFVGIVGLKGSGKTSTLHFLEKRGEEVLEVYRELDHLRNNSLDELASLPPRKDWEDEPLQLILRKRGVTPQTQRRIFLGSLLRRSEVELLSKYGKVTLLHISSTNFLRHERARNRGRAIEVVADKNRLIELDAHRDGLWSDYEQNDLGGLVDLCKYTVMNDQNTLPDNVGKKVYDLFRKEAW